MRELTLDLASRTYSIFIGSGLLESLRLFARYFGKGKIAVVSNETIAPLYLEKIESELRGLAFDVITIILPDGEKYKNWETLNRIFDGLLTNNCERTTTLVALGGGVIGDMGGFAAACYQRGMPFVQIPTTLLAQVDSSVGGKTAINHPLGKNMIGAFYQPQAVIADTNTLNTLPDRELSAGLAEVIKYGLIGDLQFLGWIEKNLDRILARDPEALAHIIFQSCSHKARIVAADERETGERALLNLGHTFGHAIETAMGYGTWLHGEAVAAGTMMALELSRLLGWLDVADVNRVEGLFLRAGLPVRGPNMEVGRYIELMGHDKKVVDGKLRLVLLRELGKAVIADDVVLPFIAEAIALRTEDMPSRPMAS